MINKDMEAIINRIDEQEMVVAVDSLARPRKDKLVKTIGDLYDFKLNEITGKITS